MVALILTGLPLIKTSHSNVAVFEHFQPEQAAVAVVFGPTSLGGISLRPLCVKQSYPETSALLLLIRQQSRLCQMMWTRDAVVVIESDDRSGDGGNDDRSVDT
jgi:hypothetical protein